MSVVAMGISLIPLPLLEVRATKFHLLKIPSLKGGLQVIGNDYYMKYLARILTQVAHLLFDKVVLLQSVQQAEDIFLFLQECLVCWDGSRGCERHAGEEADQRDLHGYNTLR